MIADQLFASTMRLSSSSTCFRQSWTISTSPCMHMSMFLCSVHVPTACVPLPRADGFGAAWPAIACSSIRAIR